MERTAAKQKSPGQEGADWSLMSSEAITQQREILNSLSRCGEALSQNCTSRLPQSSEGPILRHTMLVVHRCPNTTTLFSRWDEMLGAFQYIS